MAHEGLWERLERLDGGRTAQRAKCEYLSDPARFVVTLLNTAYVVNLTDRNIFAAHTGSAQEPASFLEQLCLLAYLINAQKNGLDGNEQYGRRKPRKRTSLYVMLVALWTVITNCCRGLYQHQCGMLMLSVRLRSPICICKMRMRKYSYHG